MSAGEIEQVRGSEPSREPGLPLRRALPIFCAMGALYAVSYFVRAGIPNTIFNQLQMGFGTHEAAEIVSLGSIFFYVYAAMQIPVGLLAYRYGGMRMALLGGVLMMAGTAAFSQAGSLGSLYAARAVTALGAGFMYLCATRELDWLFGHRNFAVSMGALLAMGYVGGMAGMAPFDLAAHAWGWQSVVLGVAGFSAVALIACVAIGGRRSVAAEGRAEGFSLGGLWAVLRNKRSYAPILGGYLNSSVYFVFQNILGKKFLEDVGGLRSSVASTANLVVVATAAGVVFSSGMLSRWIGDRRKPLAVTAVCLTLAATGLILTAIELRLPAWVLVCGYVMYAVSTGLGAAFVAAVREVNPPSLTAVSIGLYNGTGYFLLAVLAQVAGAILDRFPATVTATAKIYPPQAYRALFLVLLGVAVVALGFTLAMRETHGRTSVPEPEMA